MKMKYKKTRICSNCNKELFYSCVSSYNLSQKTNAVCKSCSNTKKQSHRNNIARLMDGSNESFYWIGFILADGHISNSNRLKITLSIKDVDHIKEFSTFISSNITYSNGQCSTSAMDSVFIPLLCERFDIRSNRTEFPPNVSIFNGLSEDQLLSLFVGFIDGDGCIGNLHKRKDFNLRIKCHGSWIDILTFFKNKYFPNNGSCILNNQSYSQLSIGDSFILKELKRNVEKLKVPFLKRKWDIIDYDFVSNYERCQNRWNEIKYHLKNGMSQKDISKLMNMSSGGVSMLIKRKSL